MEFTQFIRKPFAVEVMEITADNIEEVAELINGEVVTKGEKTFIQLNRRVIPNVNRAFVGWFLTRLDGKFRCYSAKVFNEQFASQESEIGYYFGKMLENEEIPETGYVVLDNAGTVVLNVFEEPRVNSAEDLDGIPALSVLGD